jgi:hypothetical protein
VKKYSCLFHRSNSPGARPSQRASAESGYILLIVMMMATLLLISLAAAVPSIYVEGQREKEKELIFRGEQYSRAIILFHQKFNRYPSSVKELLHTNNLSFLRQAYPDPMTKSGKWRFIHATANGVILDSKLLGPPGKQNKGPIGSNSGSPMSQSAPAPVPANQPATQNSSQQGGFQMGNFSLQTPGQNSGQSLGQNQQQSGSSFFGENKMVGAFIVGVASTSRHQSIGVFDKQTEYDMWEFLGVPGAPGAPKIGGQAVVPGGAQPGQSPFGGAGTQPNSGGGFHLGSSQPSQPSQPSSILGGSSNP